MTNCFKIILFGRSGRCSREHESIERKVGRSIFQKFSLITKIHHATASGSAYEKHYLDDESSFGMHTETTKLLINFTAVVVLYLRWKEEWGWLGRGTGSLRTEEEMTHDVRWWVDMFDPSGRLYQRCERWWSARSRRSTTWCDFFKCDLMMVVVWALIWRRII